MSDYKEQLKHALKFDLENKPSEEEVFTVQDMRKEEVENLRAKLVSGELSVVTVLVQAHARGFVLGRRVQALRK